MVPEFQNKDAEGRNANFQEIFISADSLGSKTKRNMWNEIPKKFVNILDDSFMT